MSRSLRVGFLSAALLALCTAQLRSDGELMVSLEVNLSDQQAAPVVLRRGEALGVPVPANRLLWTLVRLLEDKHKAANGGGSRTGGRAAMSQAKDPAILYRGV